MYKPVMERFGKPQALNICVLGALLELTHVTSFQSIDQCLKARFRPAFHKANEEALSLGQELAASWKNTHRLG